MATILRDRNQPRAVNLDNIDFIELKVLDTLFTIVFYKYMVREAYVGPFSVATWKYSSPEERDAAASKIINQFGIEITE